MVDAAKKAAVPVCVHLDHGETLEYLQQALDTGNRTIMMDSGEIVFDISGEEREKMTVKDLVNLFAEKRKKELTNDRMMLG